MKNLIALTLLLGGSTLLCAQKPAKTPATYKPVKSEMYRKGWIDFNKNGVKDVYEDPSAPLEARIENLLQQMTLDEKTCQMVTLYGYKRVLKDDLPTPEWKELLWKDGIGAIDEHLNGFQQWGLPPSDNAYVWPASRHAWALNEGGSPHCWKPFRCSSMAPIPSFQSSSFHSGVGRSSFSTRL